MNRLELIVEVNTPDEVCSNLTAVTSTCFISLHFSTEQLIPACSQSLQQSLDNVQIIATLMNIISATIIIL